MRSARSGATAYAATKGELYRAVDADDTRLLNDLQRQLLEEQPGVGRDWWHQKRSPASRAMSDEFYRPHMHHYLRMLSQSLDQELDLDAIALPPAGNPFGMVMEDASGELDYQPLSRRVSRQSARVTRPAGGGRIGGGVGYFARSILRGTRGSPTSTSTFRRL